MGFEPGCIALTCMQSHKFSCNDVYVGTLNSVAGMWKLVSRTVHSGSSQTFPDRESIHTRRPQAYK
jgi:hypothetical protein